MIKFVEKAGPGAYKSKQRPRKRKTKNDADSDWTRVTECICAIHAEADDNEMWTTTWASQNGALANRKTILFFSETIQTKVINRYLLLFEIKVRL